MTDTLIERLKHTRKLLAEIGERHHYEPIDEAITALKQSEAKDARIAGLDKNFESALIEALEYGFLAGRSCVDFDGCIKDWRHQSTLADTAYWHTNAARQALKGTS